jgi:pyrimidine-nucleoside phosphorylase|tara:strand:+ start:8816 stop:10117 length:1302 start_codon:yes stop_codon:yes gene_type:complete
MNHSLINAKVLGINQSPEEIITLIHHYSEGQIDDAEMTSWLKAVCEHGMSHEETFAVVEAMVSSGSKMGLSHINRFKCDKHSTGGVGDKVSLILGPLMAAAGLVIPMISGRSLGHTGGTLDKLESIPGYRTDLSIKKFLEVVEKVGISMVGQTDDICPADKKMYALRDRTNTVKSVPLICGSIMSKKIAEGIEGLVLDIKVGNGAFMQTIEEARELGQKMIEIGKHFGIKTDVIFTNMNQPLGREAGLWNEVKEAVYCLKGNGPDDLMEVVYELGNHLLIQSGKTDSKEDGLELQKNLILNGSALNKLKEMVERHSGDSTALDDIDSLHQPKFKKEISATGDGFITHMDTLSLGKLVNSLTIYSDTENRIVDNSGGIRFIKKLGDPVQTGDTIAVCFGNNESKVESVSGTLIRHIQINETNTTPPEIILGELD